MRVAIGSMFRNSAGYVDRYFDQIAALHDALPADTELRLILAEGDSTDATYSLLNACANQVFRGYTRAAAFAIEVFKREHGGPTFGSVEDAQRWRQISYVMDGVLERIPERTDVFVWVESDLLWQPTALLELLAAVVYGRADAVAPLSLMANGQTFYDTWGYRKDGQRFTPQPPYHPALDRIGLTPIDSAGSCIVTRGDVARATRCTPADQGIVGWCADMRAHGYTLWLDPAAVVTHP